MTDQAPITQCDGAVVIRGAALPLMYRSTLALNARRSRDGLAASPCCTWPARRSTARACPRGDMKMTATPSPSHAATARAGLRTRKLPNGGLPRGVFAG